MSDNQDKRTATQRIEDLEKVITNFYQGLTQINGAVQHLLKGQGDIGLLKEALKILNKKTEAIIQLADPSTGITVDAVSSAIVKMNVTELTAQVAEFVRTGHLVPAETTAKDSYVVAEEYGADGTLVNPRIQFRLDSQDEATNAALSGKKAGDTVNFGENKFSAKILEVYTITEPAPEAAPTTAATDPTAQTPAETAPAPSAPAPTNAGSFDSPPAETPVTEFVPSDASTMATASS